MLGICLNDCVCVGGYDSVMKHIKNVKVDYREGRRTDYAKEFYKDYNVEIMTLEEGDFLFESNDGMQVLFEYKTGKDFLNSIHSHRLHNQTSDACVNYDYQFVIVQAFSLHDLMNSFYYDTGIRMSQEQINGSVARLNTISTVLFAQTQESAFDLMERQAHKIFDKKPLAWKYGKKTVNPALNYLRSIKGVGKQANLIVDSLGVRTLEELLSLSIIDLRSVDGIGDKKAKSILKAIKRGR